MNNKIILGTVQLGMPYGINNSIGKPLEQEAFSILDFAFEQGILTLDSADVYGEALNVIANHKSLTGKEFKIINKFKVDQIPLSSKLDQNLKLLQLGSLYCYMYHQYSDYESNAVSSELINLKHEGKVQKIGVSIYDSTQLATVYNDPTIDIIQLPVNILDLSEEKKLLLQKAKDAGKEVHARSVYLQGLFLKNPDSLEGNISQLKPYVKQLGDIAKIHHLDLKSAVLNYVLNQPFIDFVVLGIEQVSQLKENLALINPDFNTDVFKGVKVPLEDQYLLNPAKWKK